MNQKQQDSFNLVFNNELILANVFKFFRVQELKTVRLVSRFWNILAYPILQRKSIVKLNENVHEEGSVLQGFLQTFAAIPSRNVFFRNYKISLWNLDNETDSMVAFWEKFGITMESLELYCVRIVGVEVVREILFRNCPNLQRLTVRDCNFYEAFEGQKIALRICQKVAEVDLNVKVNRNFVALEFIGGELHNQLPISWEEVFLAFPNLKRLEFYNLNNADTTSILKCGISVRNKHPNHLRIERLNIFNGDYALTEIPQVSMDQLLYFKWPLKELSIDIGSHCAEKSISKLLQQHRFVEKLIIYRGPLGTPMVHFPFGIMFPNLRELEMTETVADSMKFLEFMPKLTSFSLCEPPDVEPPFLPSDLVAKTELNFPKLPLPVNLNYLRIDYDISNCDIRKLVNWFPNVKRARLYLADEGFRTVCGEWPQLEELEVLGDKLESSGITGIKTICTTMGSETEVKTYCPTNISCLTKLRKFVMKNYNLSTEVDDLSVTEGFLKMKFLSHIELCSKNITEEGWRKLYECEHILTLLPSDGKWKSECNQFIKEFQ